MDELRLKLVCIDRVRHKPSYLEEVVFNAGDVVNATLRDDGMRLEYKKNHYGLPVKVSDVAKVFKVYTNEM